MTAKYTKEVTEKLIADYENGVPTKQLAQELDVPERSVVAKLSHLGVYKKKVYLNKNGEPPIKKDIYITKIAELLDANIELLESLEKVNKRVLVMITEALEDGKKRTTT